MQSRHIFFGLTIMMMVLFAGCSSLGRHDNFASCLTENDVKMYGAYWCPHCANQKDMFGTSFDYVNYVECSLPNRAGTTQICQDEGIKIYPTWEFADGSRTEGVMALEKLSRLSGCSMEAR